MAKFIKFSQDLIRLKKALADVEVIDLVSFGSAISPEYLLTLLSHAPIGSKKFGFTGASLPGNGWSNGLNNVLFANRVRWIIGGFFATVKSVGLMAEAKKLSVVNFPQGVLSKLLTTRERTFSSPIGKDTFIDPHFQAGVIELHDKSLDYLCSLIIKEKNGDLKYSLPNSQAVFLRGAGITKNGRVVPEIDPIDLDIVQVAQAARERGTKCIFQVPFGVIYPNETEALPLAEHDVVFEAPKELHSVGWIPNHYITDEIKTHGRRGSLVSELAEKLQKRISEYESLIIGIGLPVAIIQLNLPTLNCEINVESGNIDGIPLDGSGFGYNIGSKKRISQLQMFERIWSQNIEHAILGIGEIDAFGAMNVVKLGNTLNGVGGFIDITQSLNKLSFCSRKKDRIKKLNDWVCFSASPSQNLAYLEV